MDFFSTGVAYAASERFNEFLANANEMIVNPLITLLFALAAVYFLYGVFEFIAHQDNEEKKTSGKSHMLWGVIGITIMMGVWFFLNIIISTFDIEGVNPQEGTVTLPPYNP